jgi:hypothetical protein
MKFYRINISGIGGEIVFGKATLQQYNFWNDPEHLMDAGFDESDDALTYYMTDKEEWEENIPKMARFDYEWYEIDEYGHYNGTTTDSAYIEVTEVESAECNAPEIVKKCSTYCRSAYLGPDDEKYLLTWCLSGERRRFHARCFLSRPRRRRKTLYSRRTSSFYSATAHS